MPTLMSRLVCLLLLLAQASFVAGRGKVFCVPTLSVAAVHEHTGCDCDHPLELEETHSHPGVAAIASGDEHRPCESCVHVRTPETSSRPSNPPTTESGPVTEQVNLALVIFTQALLAGDPRGPALEPTHGEPPRALRAEVRALKATRLLV